MPHYETEPNSTQLNYRVESSHPVCMGLKSLGVSGRRCASVRKVVWCELGFKPGDARRSQLQHRTPSFVILSLILTNS